MKRQRPASGAHAPGRLYTTRASFPLTWRERLNVLLGGEVNVVAQLHVQPGASDIPTRVVHSVAKPKWRWPWRREAA